MRSQLRALATLPVLLLISCSGVQSVLDPAGQQAAPIARLWWFMLIVTGICWIIVSAVLLWGIFRVPRETGDLTDNAQAKRVVAISVGVTALILFTIFGFTLAIEQDEKPDPGALVIEVVGYQWWWDVYYRADTASLQVRTANELRLPVGRQVELRVRTADVIHSLWLPNISGKIDLMPGRINTLRVRAERAGEFRGQCAEFCGVQHAKMALDVIALSEPEFNTWLISQRRPAIEPADSISLRGREVFMSTTCSLCHMVRGTIAQASVGPDLTHFGSRRTLAAGTLPNTADNLARWIADPHRIKPGTFMPATRLNDRDLLALVSYLEQLK